MKESKKKQQRQHERESKRECMGGGGGGFTGLVARLVVTSCPTIHPYCSQSYLGVLADDK